MIMTREELKRALPFKIAPNFHAYENACRCCGKVFYDTHFLYLLQKLRDKIRQPVIVNSFYRCPEHNATVYGASKNSLHMYGLAADIAVNGMSPFLLAEQARAIGLNAIEYSNFVHVDFRKPIL